LNNVYTSLKKIGTQRHISLPAQAATFVLTAGGIRRLPASTENPVKPKYPLRDLVKLWQEASKENRKPIDAWNIGIVLTMVSTKSI